MNKNFIIQNNILIKYNGNEEIVEIPNEVKTIKMNTFKNKVKIKKVILPKHCKTIENDAFRNCENLEEINLEKVVYIGNGSFYNCQKLKEININNIKNIGNNAFVKTGLTKIIFPKDFEQIVPSDIFSSEKLEEIIIEGDVFIPYKTIENLESIKKITINNNDEIISLNTMYCFKNLKEIEINNPNYKTKDGIIYNKDETAIIYCPPKIELSDYIIPDTVKKINDFAFCKVTTIDTLIFGDNIEIIGKNAFESCKINEIILNKKCNRLDEECFMHSNIKLLDLSETDIKKIDLDYCGIIDITWNDIINISKIDNIILPNNVEDINFSSYKEITDELSKMIKIKRKKDYFNKKIQKFIEQYNIKSYYKTLDNLLEEGKTFREASKIISKQER